MVKLMPQEMEVWYLLPALRKELSTSFIKDFKLSQKDAASILGLSEGAISHYVKSKRANQLKFSSKEKAIIKKYAGKMIKDKKNTIKYLYWLCIELRGCGCMCKLHRELDSSIKGECAICNRKIKDNQKNETRTT
jgi:uncharacterized protein